MNANDKVLQLVQQSGPVIPSQISKEIGTDILLASAMLSDLASQNKVRISSVKVGGSPLYYTDGQEDKLQKFVDKLPQMEQKAVFLLRENKIIRDSAAEPAVRYALRQIKDFAKPLEVTANGVKEVFWKWYLLPTKEAEPLIKKELIKVQKPEVRQEMIKPVAELVPKLEISRPAQAIERKEPEVNPAVKPEVKQAPPVQKKPAKKTEIADAFLGKVQDFFKKNSIEILEQSSRKKSDADYVIKVPSAVGTLQYYCRAKNKKSCNEADLSEAIVQGQLRRLPVLFLASGDVTKPAQALLANGQLNISFRKV